MFDEIQHAETIPLARQLNIEVGDAQLEQAREQLRVVDIRAVRRIAVATRTRVDAEPPPLLVAEAIEHAIVERDEGAQQSQARVQLHGQAPLGEVDLHGGGARGERAPNVRFGLVNQVLQKRFSRVAGDAIRGIQQAQRRRRDDRLFQRPVCVALGGLGVGGRIRAIPERPGVSRGSCRV